MTAKLTKNPETTTTAAQNHPANVTQFFESVCKRMEFKPKVTVGFKLSATLN